MKNSEIRKCEEEIVNVLNAYDFPFEVKRIMLSNLARYCENEANKAIIEESKPIEEKGEL